MLGAVQYEELPAISRAEYAVASQSDSADEVAAAILRLALHDPDLEFVDSVCREQSESESLAVRRAAVLSLGYLARRTGRASDASRTRLRELASDTTLAGAASDAIDDITTFASS